MTKEMKTFTHLIFDVDPEFKEQYQKEALRMNTSMKGLLLLTFKTWQNVTAEEEKRKK